MTDPIQPCAALVARGDPVRFRAAMAAPLPARKALFPLYAFNLEVVRAPWLTDEPMIAEMRLQFWRDVIEDAAAGKPPRAHEVAAPFAQLIRDKDLPADLLDGLVAARRWDIYRDAHADLAAFWAYLDDTGGALVWAAALALGAPAAVEPAIRAFGRAAALAAYLQAVPDLEARGRVPLVDGRAQAVRDLAQTGLSDIDTARAARLPRSVQPALWPGVGAAHILRQAARAPQRVADGQLTDSALRQSLRLMRVSSLGGY